MIFKLINNAVIRPIRVTVSALRIGAFSFEKGLTTAETALAKRRAEIEQEKAEKACAVERVDEVLMALQAYRDENPDKAAPNVTWTPQTLAAQKAKTQATLKTIAAMPPRVAMAKAFVAPLPKLNIPANDTEHARRKTGKQSD